MTKAILVTLAWFAIVMGSCVLFAAISYHVTTLYCKPPVLRVLVNTLFVALFLIEGLVLTTLALRW